MTDDYISIVFVHGLQGDALTTWTTSGVRWPKDLLPQDFPDARILSFGYTAVAGGDTEDKPLSISDLSKRLLRVLSINRKQEKATTRPLIFMAHNIGGIIVKSVRIHKNLLLLTCAQIGRRSYTLEPLKR